MKFAKHITHYFEHDNGPFRSICDLSPGEVKKIVERERNAETGFNRYSHGEEFFDFRRLADDALLELYAEKFGQSPPRRPFYAVLGTEDVVAGLYRNPHKISMSVDQFMEAELTFMVPDHFHLVGLKEIKVKKHFGWQLPKDYTEERYPMYGKLLTYQELKDRFEDYCIDEYIARNRIANNWYRYVEAQIWADPKSMFITEEQWIEAEPEPWTYNGVSYLQNYKRIRTEQSHRENGGHATASHA